MRLPSALSSGIRFGMTSTKALPVSMADPDCNNFFASCKRVKSVFAGICLLCITLQSLPVRALEILAAGDVTPAWRMYDWPPCELFSEAARERIGKASLFVWNCETSGLSSTSKTENAFRFHADGRFFDLMRFGNGVACTVNNHVFDGHEEGAGNLLRILDENGIRHHGIHPRGQYRPVRINSSINPPVYFLAGSPMSQIGSGPMLATLNYPQLLETTLLLRQRDTRGIIAVSIHDGIEHEASPSPRQMQWAYSLAHAGADVVLFTHSHVYGPFEVLKDTPRGTFVAWGLGNFLFGGNCDWKTQSDVRMLSVRIDPLTGKKEGHWIFGQTNEWEFSLRDEPLPGTQTGKVLSASAGKKAWSEHPNIRLRD
jgi:hypothetical protein